MRTVLPSLLALVGVLAFVALPQRGEWEAEPRADTVAFRENFDGERFPPSGWSRINHNDSKSAGWGVERTDFPTLAAEHEDEYGLVAENSLQTPVINLSDYSQAFLHFQSLTWYAEFQAGHQAGAGDGVSSIEISVDGGQSFTRGFWVSEQHNSGVIEQVNIDLSPFAGQAEIVLRFNYRGTFAHNWIIDSMVVDAWPTSPPPPPGPPTPWAYFEPASSSAISPLDSWGRLELVA